MAKAVKLPKNREFQFTSGGGGGASGKYPWDEWFNGSLLLLERSDADDEGNVTGEKRDYEVHTNAMPPKIKTAARRRYKIVQISRKDADGNKLNEAVIIRARDMTDEERLAEDVLRAEEKADRKADDNGVPATLPVAPLNQVV